MPALDAVAERLGDSHRTFDCCATTFTVRATGVRAAAATRRARETAKSLERQLDAFDEASAVSQLNRESSVENPHVARIVSRGLEYHERTDGSFDIHNGRVEDDLKSYLRGEEDTLPASFDTGTVSVAGDRVLTDTPLDLNGLAKGYIVDQAAAALDGVARRGFISGGGDMSPPTGPVAIESPHDGDQPLRTLDTSWAVATSGGYRRQRGGVDHIYDPTGDDPTGDDTAGDRFGAKHDSVTVVARRDCMEADALATTLAARPLDDALSLAEAWDGAAAFVLHDGVFRSTEGFENHVMDT
ncbi:MAG: FAD:protein FMN transferase [Halonotius sp.]